MIQKQPQRPRRFHAQPKQWEQPDKNHQPQPSKRTGRPGVLRTIPLGGLEEVGRNSMVFEYGNDIIIIDLGLQFPEDDMPGIDYSIPNISYLKGKERNIRGIIVTHGHYDHIGGIPHLAPKLGNPPIYSSDLTLAMIQIWRHQARSKLGRLYYTLLVVAGWAVCLALVRTGLFGW
jgi:mRNA degradation ribonuclease J1/J2